MTTEGNYTQIAGNSDGDTKVAVVKEIVKLFEEARIVKKRKPIDILQKVTAFRSKYNSAYEWTQNTGAGVDKDNISFSEMCIKKIKYWNELEPIFGDYASSKPVVNSDDIDHLLDKSSSSDDDDDDDNNTNDDGIQLDSTQNNNNNDDDDNDDDTEEDRVPSADNDGGGGDDDADGTPSSKKRKGKSINSKRGDNSSNPNKVASINKVFESSLRKQEKHCSQQLKKQKKQKKQAKETTEYRKEQLAIKKREITVLEGQEKVKENEQKYIDYQRYQELKNTGLPLE